MRQGTIHKGRPQNFRDLRPTLSRILANCRVLNPRNLTYYILVCLLLGHPTPSAERHPLWMFPCLTYHDASRLKDWEEKGMYSPPSCQNQFGDGRMHRRISIFCPSILWRASGSGTVTLLVIDFLCHELILLCQMKSDILCRIEVRNVAWARKKSKFPAHWERKDHPTIAPDPCPIVYVSHPWNWSTTSLTIEISIPNSFPPLIFAEEIKTFSKINRNTYKPTVPEEVKDIVRRYLNNLSN